MAVYTHITDAQVSEFLGNYNIGTLQSLKGIAEGVQNSNFLLTTTKGQYILTLYENMVNEDDLPFFISLMEHLAENGISCPRPIKMKNGRALTKIAGRPAALVSFLNGYSVISPNAEHCRQCGIALANMHLAVADIDVSRDNDLSQKNWKSFYQKSAERAGEVSADLPKIMEDELNWLDENWPTSLPSAVVHADLFPDNVFFLEEKLSGLIDFYFAANDLLAYDLAICINAWCFDGDSNFDSDKSAALIAGYQSVRQLDQDEVQAFAILCRGGALRFILTRLYDWLNVPPNALVTPHDPMNFVTRLKFHQSVTSIEQYGFEAQVKS